MDMAGVGWGRERLNFVSFDTKCISMFLKEGSEVNTGYVCITGNFADLRVLTLSRTAHPSRTGPSGVEGVGRPARE